MKNKKSIALIKGILMIAALLTAGHTPLQAASKSDMPETLAQENLLAIAWYHQADKALGAYRQLQARGDEAAIATLKAIIREYSLMDNQLASAKQQN